MHNCFDYWHPEADALCGALNQHLRGAGRLMYQETYDSLVNALRRIERALNINPPANVPPYIRFVADDPAVRGLADAFSTWLDNDERNTLPPGTTPHTAGVPGWFNTGPPDAGAVLELTDLYGRIKNVLGA
jgi:hypothetical protein